MTAGNGQGGPIITQDQAMGIIRQIVPLLAGVAIGKGWLTADQAQNATALVYEIAGPAAAIGGAFLTYFANSKHSILLSVAKMPEVQQVTLSDSQMADAVPSPKVINGNAAQQQQQAPAKK